MQKRAYGPAGTELSIIGMGGIVVMGLEQSKANRIVRDAFDRGINYYDVAPSYGDAEDRLGPALVGLRDQVFLACKTGQRTASGAEQEMHKSFQRLQTDHFDLYQLHGLTSVEEVETCFGSGGAMETVVAARQAGNILHVGFSAHSTDAALRALELYDFDSVLFPFNVTTFKSGFGPEVLKRAAEKGASRLALKAMAKGSWPEGADRSICPNCWYEPHADPVLAELALRWTLSLPITAAIPPGDPVLWSMALEFAERFEPISEDEAADVETQLMQKQPLFAA